MSITVGVVPSIMAPQQMRAGQVSIDADIRQAHITEVVYEPDMSGISDIHGQAMQIDEQGREFRYRWCAPSGTPMTGNMYVGGTMQDLLSSDGANVRLNGLTIGYPVSNSAVTDVSYGDITAGTPFYWHNTQSPLTTQPTSVDFGGRGMPILIGPDGRVIIQTDSSAINTNYVMMGDGIAIGGPPTETKTRRVLEVAEGPEETARGLLKRMVGERAFRNYIRNGFISYRSKSGKVYQIYPGSKMTKVWENGQPLKTLCVVFKDYSMPPTDWVIMRLLMLEHDEVAFWALANKFDFHRPVQVVAPAEVAGGRILQLAQRRKTLGLRADLWPKDGHVRVA